MPSPCSDSSSSEYKPKLKVKSLSPKKKSKKVTVDDFPLNTTTNVNSPTIPIFGSSTTALTIPFPLSFCSTSPLVAVTVTGVCGGTLTFNFALTAPAVAGVAATTVFSLTCTGGVVTAAALAGALPAALSPTPTITIAGLPIIGTVPSSVSSTDPVASQLCVRQEKCAALVTGAISESINFTAVPANISDSALTALASALLDALFAPLLTGACGATALAGLLVTLPANFAAVVLALFGIVAATDTVAELVAAIVAALEPSVVADLRAALVGSSQLANQQVPPFGFALSISDPALSGIEKCDKLCATANVCFAGATGAPLAVSTLPTSFTLTATSSCASLIATGSPIVLSIPIADLLAAISPSLAGATTLPAIFCATVGTSCIPVSPAIVKTDKVNLVINHGKACCCPPSQASSSVVPLCPVPSSGFLPSSSFFPSSGFFPSGGCCGSR